MSVPEVTIASIQRLELSFTPKLWPFALQRRADIAAHFAVLQRRKPKVWNGRVLLLHDMKVDDGIFRGAFLETDFASFRAWKDLGHPPAGVWDCFGLAAIAGADGSWLLGVMGEHTANAGQVYFPCGTPDPRDVKNGQVDLEFSVARELAEETGLRIDDFQAEPGWTMVTQGATAALFKVVHSARPVSALRDQVRGHLARERHPELADMRIVRGPADIVTAMPDFVTAFLMKRWR
jgi:8-oxo-dGTP pyrophosphatase MutT (NUDIX family)